MNFLQQMIVQQLSGAAVSQISQRLGINPGLVQQAIGVAIPLLVSALSRNAASPQGANALHQALNNDHDGSILDNIGDFLGNANAGNGAGILGHVLGEQQANVQQGLAQQTGLTPNTSGQLLETLAPLVMGALGRTQQQQGFDPGSLASFLGDQHQQSHNNNPDLMGMVGGLLDANRDGNVMDDVLNIAGKMFGRR